MKTKNKYQQSIFTYLERREIYKAKYGKNSIKYLKLSRNINKRLTVYRAAIKRIEKRDWVIYNLDKCVIEFIGRSAYKSVNAKEDITILARNLFIKYGMEHNICGIYLAEYVGLKYKQDGSRDRLKFTRTFSSNKHNKEMWHRFQDYMKSTQSKTAA